MQNYMGVICGLLEKGKLQMYKSWSPHFIFYKANIVSMVNIFNQVNFSKLLQYKLNSNVSFVFLFNFLISLIVIFPCTNTTQNKRFRLLQQETCIEMLEGSHIITIIKKFVGKENCSLNKILKLLHTIKDLDAILSGHSSLLPLIPSVSGSFFT